MRTVRRGLAVIVLALCSTGAARADERGEACDASYVKVQRLRRAGSLIAARSEVAVCLRTCGEAGRKDCAEWLDAIDKAVPSVVVSARRDGEDVLGAKASIDGAAVASKGVAVDVDPGTHTIVVQDGTQRVSQTVVVAEGEKGRLLVLVLPARLAATPSAPPTPPAAGADREPATLRPSTVALGVAGLVGLVGFGVLSLYGNHRYSDLEACRGHCAESDVRATKSAYLAGDIMLGVGVVCTTAAIVTYLLGRTTIPTKTSLNR
jgi:hypothetical protein